MEIHKRGKDTEEKTGSSRVFLIRQILNVIFMIGAVAGGLLYWFIGHTCHNDIHVLQNGRMCIAVQKMSTQGKRYSL